jgi:hypothetical protein
MTRNWDGWQIHVEFAYSYLFDGTEGNIEHDVASRRYVAMFTKRLQDDYPGAAIEIAVGRATPFSHERETRVVGPIQEGQEGYEAQQSMVIEVSESVDTTAMLVLEDWTDWLIDLGA